ncbi:hypothetical protein KY348_02830 [Candidatus Woesearchaeota archaeon]|nr:hypothetical protein [Candidatus Woesearchaeota archaeon]
MWSKDELTDVVFKGWFESYKESSLDYPDDPRKADFSLWILDYLPDSGLFLARTNDHFGESGIIGTILGSQIKFDKAYPNLPYVRSRAIRSKGFFDDYNFRIIHYSGEIIKPDNVITAGGDYTHRGMKGPNGTWRMDSQPKK